MRFLQTVFWADFKSDHGWKKLIVDPSMVTDLDESVTVLLRSFSIKIKKFTIAYIPMVPEGNLGYKELYSKMDSLAQKIKPFLPANTICIRFDPAVDFLDTQERDSYIKDFEKHSKDTKSCWNIVKTKTNIQPPDTVLLPLAGTEDEILAGMKNKWRYNIRLAQKKGVTVTCLTADNPDFSNGFEEFYKLFQQTSERDGVQFHAKNYYLDLLNKSQDAVNSDANTPKVSLYIAKHEEDYLAGIITLFCQGEGVYLYGASGNVKRNFMPAYLLQWNAICDAKAYGCPVYDFYGCPPTEDPNHPMHGLFLFKTGFGGNLIHRPGSFDVVINNNNYRLYAMAENFRAWWHKSFLKKIKGR